MDLPMAAADALFLWAETPTRPLHVGALAVLSQPDNGTGRYLRKVFSAAVARQQVAPWWRRRPHRSLTSLGQWSWRTETEVDLDYHVRLSALPPRAGTAELWALVSELHAGMLDRSRPLWQVDLIEGLPGGRCAVYVKVHHALADGVSVMRLLQRIVTADPHQRQMPTLWEVPAQASVAKHTAPRGSSRPLTLAKGVLGQARGVPGMVRVVADTTWRAAQCRSGPLTLAAPHTPLNEPIAGARSVAGCSFPIERLRQVAEHADATINDVVLAMCGGALRAYLISRGALPGAPLIAMVPVSLRDTAVIDVFGQGPGNKIGVDVFAGDAPGQSGRTAVGDTGKYARRQSRDRRPKPKPGAGYERIGRRPARPCDGPGARARAAAPTKCDDLQRAGPAGRAVLERRSPGRALPALGTCRWRGVEHHL